MSKLSNDQGRAYEFAYLIILEKEISKHRKITVEQNSSYFASKRAWDLMSDKTKETFFISASTGVKTIFEMEPLILEDGSDNLDVKIQLDSEGEVGDVRDVLIIRRGIEWEIGLSLKHNHFAVKHSRLAKNLDFGDRWFSIKCSDNYWRDIKPIFDYLDIQKSRGLKWSDLDDKNNDVYVPLMKAFINEIKHNYDKYGKIIPTRMVEYLLGGFDFYKVISIDNKLLTQVQTFNLRGTLNKSSKTKKPGILVPVSGLPNRIVSIDFKPGSTNTVELYLDAGWQFSFRIHNASTLVESSLKFDVQIIGMPATIIMINSRWK